MRPHILLSLVLLLAGCEFDLPIFPPTPVVTEGSDFDFNFVGDWIAVPRHPAHDDKESHVYIDFDAKTREYSVRFDSDWPFEMTARAARIPKSNYALIDLKLKQEEEETHRIGYATQKDDRLYVWWISEKRLASVAKANDLKIEFERRLVSTVIKCDQEELLQLALKNSGELVGSVSEIFRRAPKEK